MRISYSRHTVTSISLSMLYGNLYNTVFETSYLLTVMKGTTNFLCAQHVYTLLTVPEGGKLHRYTY